MLTLQQVRDLLDADMLVRHNSERVCVFTYFGGLYRSHPSDEAGEDWERIESDFSPTEYTVHDADEWGSRFHNVPELTWDGDQSVAATKVVKFRHPTPLAENLRPVHHYVIMTFKDPDVTDEVATEKAIDFLVNAGWPEEKALPLLVI